MCGDRDEKVLLVDRRNREQVIVLVPVGLVDDARRGLADGHGGDLPGLGVSPGGPGGPDLKSSILIHF